MAALEVVKSRLDECGLGEFCLELHSHKTQKVLVIQELGKSLENNSDGYIFPFNGSEAKEKEVFRKLTRIREELNHFVKGLHKPYGKMQFTPYQIHGKLLALHGAPDVNFKFFNPLDVDHLFLDTLRDHIKQLKKLSLVIETHQDHPWQGAFVENFSLELKQDLLLALQGVEEGLTDLQKELRTSIKGGLVKLIESMALLKDLIRKTVSTCSEIIIESCEKIQKRLTDEILTILSKLQKRLEDIRNNLTEKINSLFERLHSDLVELQKEARTFSSKINLTPPARIDQIENLLQFVSQYRANLLGEDLPVLSGRFRVAYTGFFRILYLQYWKDLSSLRTCFKGIKKFGYLEACSMIDSACELLKNFEGNKLIRKKISHITKEEEDTFLEKGHRLINSIKENIELLESFLIPSKIESLRKIADQGRLEQLIRYIKSLQEEGKEIQKIVDIDRLNQEGWERDFSDESEEYLLEEEQLFRFQLQKKLNHYQQLNLFGRSLFPEPKGCLFENWLKNLDFEEIKIFQEFFQEEDGKKEDFFHIENLGERHTNFMGEEKIGPAIRETAKAFFDFITVLTNKLEEELGFLSLVLIDEQFSNLKDMAYRLDKRGLRDNLNDFEQKPEDLAQWVQLDVLKRGLRDFSEKDLEYEHIKDAKGFFKGASSILSTLDETLRFLDSILLKKPYTEIYKTTGKLISSPLQDMLVLFESPEETLRDWVNLNKLKATPANKNNGNVDSAPEQRTSHKEACLLVRDIQEYLDEITHLVSKGKTKPLEANFRKAYFEPVILEVQNLIEQIDLLQYWCDFQRIQREFEDRDLGDFIQKLISRPIDSNFLEEAFFKRFFYIWLNQVYKQSPALSDFRSSDFQEKIQEFKQLDKKQLDVSKHRIAKKLVKNRDNIDWLAQYSKGLSVIRREVSKKRRHKPIRSLFAEIEEVLPVLKPCLLMSPLSVSSFLNHELHQFDVVIFDEASQIPPEEALGSILRAKQSIIVGDSKQLPPYQFLRNSRIRRGGRAGN